MIKEQLPRIYLYRRIVLAKLFIDKHYAEKIDLDEIAGEASFSKFHFIRLFKMAYNKTPHQYLTHVRIEHSKLLLQTTHSISDVCYAVGFEELSSFTNLFKKLNHITPSHYKQQQLRRKKEMEEDPLRFIPGCFADRKGWVKNRNSQQME